MFSIILFFFCLSNNCYQFWFLLLLYNWWAGGQFWIFQYNLIRFPAERDRALPAKSRFGGRLLSGGTDEARSSARMHLLPPLHRVHECPTTSPPGHRGNGKSVWLALVRRARKQKGDEQVYHIKHAGTLRKMNVSNFSALAWYGWEACCVSAASVCISTNITYSWSPLIHRTTLEKLSRLTYLSDCHLTIIVQPPLHYSCHSKAHSYYVNPWQTQFAYIRHSARKDWWWLRDRAGATYCFAHMLRWVRSGNHSTQQRCYHWKVLVRTPRGY